MSELSAAPMPALFVSHGSPMAAVEQGPFQEALASFGRRFHPAAIVCISAHWSTGLPVGVTSSPQPGILHDFGGFPPELYALRYDAPGAPALATRVVSALNEAGFPAAADDHRRLDHGTWVPLRHMYPEARIPVVQVSLPEALPPRELFRFGAALAPLRREGVLILASGGDVHNLRTLEWSDRDAPPVAWAREFDEWLWSRLRAGDVQSCFDYREAGPHAQRAVPTLEHFVPIFIAMGAVRDGEIPVGLHEGFEYGTLSMRCVYWNVPETSQV